MDKLPLAEVKSYNFIKMKKIIKSISLLSLLPWIASAQAVGPCVNQASGTLGSIICKIGNLLNLILPILIVLGVVYFVWGVIEYVRANDEESRKKGRDHMIYGIIGLFIIVALWGIINVLQNSFGVQNTGSPVDVPQIGI